MGQGRGDEEMVYGGHVGNNVFIEKGGIMFRWNYLWLTA